MKRTALKRRTPMKRRTRPGDDPEYLRWIRTLPCSVKLCIAHALWGTINCIEAHHAGPRGFGRRASDRTAIPLCAYHHRIGPDAAHVLGKNFWQHHGIDRDALIAELNARYEAKRQKPFDKTTAPI